MKYTGKTFMVAGAGTDDYRSNWERTFRGGHGAQGEPATGTGLDAVANNATAPHTPPPIETPIANLCLVMMKVGSAGLKWHIAGPDGDSTKCGAELQQYIKRSQPYARRYLEVAFGRESQDCADCRAWLMGDES